MTIAFSNERASLPHGSSILVVREGKILACKRKTSDLWGYPGGKIEEGESPRAGAIRELFEETGITASANDLELIHEGVCSNDDPNDTPYWVYFFRLNPSSPCEPKPMPGEPPFQWMSPRIFLNESAFPSFNAETLRSASMPI